MPVPGRVPKWLPETTIQAAFGWKWKEMLILKCLQYTDNQYYKIKKQI
jgi:hypothetical protein